MMHTALNFTEQGKYWKHMGFIIRLFEPTTAEFGGLLLACRSVTRHKTGHFRDIMSKWSTACTVFVVCAERSQCLKIDIATGVIKPEKCLLVADALQTCESCTRQLLDDCNDNIKYWLCSSVHLLSSLMCGSGPNPSRTQHSHWHCIHSVLCSVLLVCGLTDALA